MRLLFLGELDIHARAFIPFLSRHGHNVTVINTSHWSFPKKIDGTDIIVHNLYENNKIRFLFKGRLEWFRKAALYSLAEKTKLIWGQIGQTIEQQEIEVIYGSWGAHSLPELRLVKKFNAPVVYEFLTYPTNIYSFAVKIENTFNRTIISSLEGRVLATQRMLDYMKNIFPKYHGRNIVFTECYPSNFFYKKRLPLLSEHDYSPHLIFIGSDVYDIFPQIKEMTRREIHIHVCYAKGLKQRLYREKSKKLVHAFKKFDYSKLLNGTLATFMTQFDACLVTYNFQNASDLARFHNSIPNRFSIALTGGIPIVMPEGYLKGCEEIINKHQIGFTYKDYDDLKNKLSDVELMNHCRRNAVEKSKIFNIENNFKKLDNFLKQMRENTIGAKPKEK